MENNFIKKDENSKYKSIVIFISYFAILVLITVISSELINSGQKEQIIKIDETSNNQLLNISEISNYLGITEEEVKKLTEIPHIRIDDKVYYPKLAIDKWLLNVELINIKTK